MVQIITENASLQCNQGFSPSQLKVTHNNFYKVANQFVATENDKVSETNIPNFGICSITKIKCIPAPIEWESMSINSNICDLKILTDKSTCQCSLGGKISVVNKGHNENHETE
ncbi:PAAR-like protein [Elizabethkingia miricola]|uniref:PAAR-like protein n=1 Tax=Elizabethkingia miricola TaxID=172045 RepID=UPI002ACD6759|nr:PAAR-like protein [Elizabethkingia miricola]WQM39424.1 PAAR-like protein [Elizabethkingia miricola]